MAPRTLASQRTALRDSLQSDGGIRRRWWRRRIPLQGSPARRGQNSDDSSSGVPEFVLLDLLFVLGRLLFSLLPFRVPLDTSCNDIYVLCEQIHTGTPRDRDLPGATWHLGNTAEFCYLEKGRRTGKKEDSLNEKMLPKRLKVYNIAHTNTVKNITPMFTI